MTRSERLKDARERAGYQSASEAANRFGWKVSTYLGHENGSRDFRVDAASVYATAFRVSPEWLMFGRQSAEIPFQNKQATLHPMAVQHNYAFCVDIALCVTHYAGRYRENPMHNLLHLPAPPVTAFQDAPRDFRPETVTAPLWIEAGEITIDATGEYDAATGQLVTVRFNGCDHAVHEVAAMLTIFAPRCAGGWDADMDAYDLGEAVCQAMLDGATDDARSTSRAEASY